MLHKFLSTSTPLMLSCMFVLFLFVPESAAQNLDSTSAQQASGGIEKRQNEWGVWGAISFDSTTLIGKTPDAKFGQIGLRYGRVWLTNDNLALSWTIDAIPVAVLSVNSFPVPRTRERTYGAGLSPIGLRLNFRRQQKFQPFAGGSAGFLFFTKNVPRPDAARFNFTYNFGGGVQIVNESGRAITIGYKYHHISNAYHSPINPGVDVQMIYAGFSVFK